MIMLTLDNGTITTYPRNSSGEDILKHLNIFDENIILIEINGVLSDLSTPITSDSHIRYISKHDPIAARALRNSTSRVMSEAVMLLYPDLKTANCCTENVEFFYDFEYDGFICINEVTSKMLELVERNAKFKRFVNNRDELREYFTTVDEPYKIQILDGIPSGNDVITYSQGSWWDLCKGPNVNTVGQIGSSFKILRVEPITVINNDKIYNLQRMYGVVFPTHKELDSYLMESLISG